MMRMSEAEIRTIAFEGLDGCGKGTAIKELSNLIDCECWESPEETKNARRRRILEEGGETDGLYEFMISSYLDEWCDIESACSEMPPGRVMLLDRCWVSPASVRSSRTGERPVWPAEFKPDVVFSIRVEEGLRRERILAREGAMGNLNSREQQLIDDDEFRDGVQRAELEMGCVPLRIRERSPAVVAMRALQSLLGMEGFAYSPTTSNC